MKYLVTGLVEYYQYVEADSEDEAVTKSNNQAFAWNQTLNHPIQDVKAKLLIVETTGSEVK